MYTVAFKCVHTCIGIEWSARALRYAFRLVHFCLYTDAQPRMHNAHVRIYSRLFTHTHTHLYAHKHAKNWESHSPTRLCRFSTALHTHTRTSTHSNTCMCAQTGHTPQLEAVHLRGLAVVRRLRGRIVAQLSWNRQHPGWLGTQHAGPLYTSKYCTAQLHAMHAVRGALGPAHGLGGRGRTVPYFGAQWKELCAAAWSGPHGQNCGVAGS